MNFEWMNILLGGVIIGISVSLMLLWNGRVTGISGIISGVLSPVKGDTGWRVYFIGGLILGGLVLKVLNPDVFSETVSMSASTTVIAGLLVGFGTLLGSGCTSGHGVCGVSRMSPRSLVATGVFMAAGIGVVYVLRNLGVIV
ncbi:MAG: membrane protein [Oligoflexia bacterium]|nr:MAG: membrane protein [Oligoflexia bacterium]